MYICFDIRNLNSSIPYTDQVYGVGPTGHKALIDYARVRGYSCVEDIVERSMITKWEHIVIVNLSNKDIRNVSYKPARVEFESILKEEDD